MQLDEGERGFSFSHEGPLDMRMNPNAKLTAETIVNEWSEEKLGQIFRDYGEEKKWRRIAAAIIAYRRKVKIKTTKELSDLIARTIGRSEKKKLHPATLVFQALRICVNDELKSVEEGLVKAIQFLSDGGRIGVISFHRLEDRIVKNIFRMAAAKVSFQGEKKEPELRLLTKKPLTPSQEEVRANRRSRSAKLRFAEKIGDR